jgi:hypothetical protein
LVYNIIMKKHYYHHEQIEYDSTPSIEEHIDAVNAPCVENYEAQYDNINLDPRYKNRLLNE